MSLEIFLRTGRTGVKNTKVGSIGNFLGDPSSPFVSTIEFKPVDYGVTAGSLVKNLNTGNTALVVSVQSIYFMILDTQIFTSTDEVFQIEVEESLSDSIYTKLDLYDNETIELTQRIKDYKDISKVFADFTKSFKIPCSKTNRRAFKNYQTSEVIGSFDARFKEDAVINIDGVEFKKGKISLLGASMSNGVSSSYNISFSSESASLKDILGDYKILDLPYLDVFNHDLSFTEIRKKFLQSSYITYDTDENPVSLENFGNKDHANGSIFGLTGRPTEAGDLIYPFISSESRYYYDSSTSSSISDKVRNLKGTGTDNGINLYDLSPSIRVIHIIRAIESFFDLKFADDSFIGSSIGSRPSYLTDNSNSQTIIDYVQGNSSFISSLYIHCGKKSGNNKENSISGSDITYLNEFASNGVIDLRTVNNTRLSVFNSRNSLRQTMYFDFDVQTSSENPYVVRVYDSLKSELLFDSGEVNGNKSFSYSFTGNRSSGTTSQVSKDLYVVVSSNFSVPSYNIINTEIKLVKTQANGTVVSTDTSYYNNILGSQLNDALDFRKDYAPTMKCIDFIKELFKMLNLVSYFEDGEIKVYTYDSYISQGDSLDVSKYIDFSKQQIERPEIYREVSYRFNEIKTVNGIKFKELTGDVYGDEVYVSDTDNSFDGGKYETKLKFDKMLYESLYDASSVTSASGQFTGTDWGYSVGESFSSVSVPSLLHFVKTGFLYSVSNHSLSGDFRLSDGGSNSFTPTSQSQQLFWSPKNFIENDASSLSTTINLNFGDEGYNDPTINQNSLFNVYHKNQILDIYNPQARIVKIDAIMPNSVFRKIKLNTKLIINNKEYRINTMKTNLNSDKTTFELISL